MATSRQGGGSSRKLHLERDLKSELTKVMSSIGKTTQGVSAFGKKEVEKFNANVEFKRLHNIELQSQDKVPLSKNNYMPYLPRRIQIENQQKIKEYLSKLNQVQQTSNKLQSSPSMVLGAP